MNVTTLPFDLGARPVTIDPTDAGELAALFGSPAAQLLAQGWLPPFAELAALNRYLWESDWYEQIGVTDGRRLLQLSQRVDFASASPVGEPLALESRLLAWYRLGHMDVVELELRLRSASSGELRSIWLGEYAVERTDRAAGVSERRRTTSSPTRGGSVLGRATVSFDAPEVARFSRASGDVNPIHLDPVAARAAGFDRPILHGCLTLAAAATAASAVIGQAEGSRLRAVSASFRQPIHWGEQIDVEVYEGSAAGVHPLRCTVAGRAALRSTWVAMR